MEPISVLDCCGCARRVCSGHAQRTQHRDEESEKRSKFDSVHHFVSSTVISLWENVLAGRRAFRRLPSERVPLDSYYDANPQATDKTYSDQMAVISDWEFDPLNFNIPLATTEVTDPTHWLALWTARAAFRDSGLDLESLDRSRIGVVLGEHAWR